MNELCAPPQPPANERSSTVHATLNDERTNFVTPIALVNVRSLYIHALVRSRRQYMYFPFFLALSHAVRIQRRTVHVALTPPSYSRISIDKQRQRRIAYVYCTVYGTLPNAITHIRYGRYTPHNPHRSKRYRIPTVQYTLLAAVYIQQCPVSSSIMHSTSLGLDAPYVLYTHGRRGRERARPERKVLCSRTNEGVNIRRSHVHKSNGCYEVRSFGVQCRVNS